MTLQGNNDFKINFIIVDDCFLFRRAIKKLLQYKLNCEVIAEVANGEEFFSLKNIYDADILLIDIQMSKCNGFEIVKRITNKYPNIKIIAVTMSNEKVYLDHLIETGLKGNIQMSRFFEHIIPALECVMSGSLYFNNEL
jgi:DNA-binding NarL/FixJ family response regulator